MLLSEAISKYLDYLRYRRNKSPTTITTYRPILNEFLRIVGDKPTNNLIFVEIDDYATRIAMTGNKVVTTKNKLTAIRGFLRWLRLYDLCSISPERVELPKLEPHEANFLTLEEQAAFLSVISNIRDLAMVKVLLSSGLRVSELTNLRIVDVYSRSVVVRHGKNNKNRVTFITKDAENVLNTYIREVRGDDEGYLFPNPSGDRLSRVIVARKVKYYAQKAQIRKEVTPHTLRHTMATNMLIRGARVEDIQKLLGHVNIQTTLIYLHFLDPYLAQIYDKIMEPTQSEAVPA